MIKHFPLTINAHQTALDETIGNEERQSLQLKNIQCLTLTQNTSHNLELKVTRAHNEENIR